MSPELFMKWNKKKMEERDVVLAGKMAERAKNDRMRYYLISTKEKKNQMHLKKRCQVNKFLLQMDQVPQHQLLVVVKCWLMMSLTWINSMRWKQACQKCLYKLMSKE